VNSEASQKYDIGAWFPSQQRYREITSTSNTTHFQSRRLNIRFRPDARLELVHMLNGTAITARAILAILKIFRTPVAVPEPLWQFGAPSRLALERQKEQQEP